MGDPGNSFVLRPVAAPDGKPLDLGIGYVETLSADELEYMATWLCKGWEKGTCLPTCFLYQE